MLSVTHISLSIYSFNDDIKLTECSKGKASKIWNCNKGRFVLSMIPSISNEFDT